MAEKPVTLEAAIDSRRMVTGANQGYAAQEKLARGAKLADGQINRLERTMSRTGRTAGGLGGVIRTLFAGFGATYLIRNAISAISNFEDTMAQVGAVTGATEKQFKSLTETAKFLGATTRFTASQAGEGLLFLARAGFTVQESMAALPHTLNLASGGAIDLGNAADIASNVLSQFNMNATETERVVDTLLSVSNSANTSVQQLADALVYAGATAGAMGKSVEETAAALGVLGNFGIQASQAGTNLRGIFAGLMGETDTAAKVIRSLGLRMDELNPVTNNLADVFEKLKDAGFEASMAFDLFGRRNVAAALALAQSTDQMRALEEIARKSAGTAQRQAAIMENTLGGSLRSLKSAWEGLMLATGDRGFGGVLRRTIDTVTGAIRILAGMGDQVENNREGALRLAQVMVILGKALIVVTSLKVAGWFAGAASGLYAMAKAGIAAAAAISGPLLVAISTLGAAFVAFKFGSWLQDEFKIVKQAAAQWVSNMRTAWEHVKTAGLMAWKVIETGWDKVVGNIKIGLAKVLGAFADMNEHLNILSTSSLNSIRELQTELRISGQFQIQTNLENELSNLSVKLEAAKEKIKGETDSIFDDIENEFGGGDRKGQSFSDFLANDLSELVGKIKPHIENLKDNIGAAFDFGNIDSLLETLSGVSLETPFENAAGAVKDLGDEIKGLEKKYKALTANQVAVMAEITKMQQGVKDDIDRILLSDPNRRREYDVSQYRFALQRGGFGDKETAAMTKDFEDLLDQREGMKRFQAAAEDMQGAFEDMAMSIIDGSKSAAEAVQDMMKSFYLTAAREAFIKPGAQAFGSLVSGLGASLLGASVSTAPPAGGGGAATGPNTFRFARGGVLPRGGLVPMASGGIAYGPQARGGGLIGEQGWEAVLPLQRDSRGRLGVSGGRQMERPVINQNITVMANDPRAFAGSRKQLARAGRDALAMADGRN